MLLLGIALLSLLSVVTGQANSKCECIAYFYCSNRTQNTNVPCEYTHEVCCELESNQGGGDPDPNPVIDGDICGKRGQPDMGVVWKIFDTEADTDTAFGEFPWMVAVMKITSSGQEFLCGGSVIYPNVILTTAHTVSGLSPSELNVKAGIWDTTSIEEMDKHQDRSVLRVVIHPGYDKGKVANDFALLILSDALQITENVAPVCLPTLERLYNQSNCIATGWGADNFGSTSVQTVLKKVMLPLIDYNTCQTKLRQDSKLGPNFNLHNSFICAGRDGADTCKGDGGGPLMCSTLADSNRFVQVGIISWGVGCKKNFPGAYSSVEVALDWIEKEADKTS